MVLELEGKRPTRRQVLRGTAAAGTGGIVGTLFTGWNGRKWRPNSHRTSPRRDPRVTIALEPIIEGLDFPVALENPVADHFYIAEKSGQVRLTVDGQLQDEPVLDIREELQLDHGEQGLLGLEFHPEFEQNGKVYVRYSATSRPGTPDGYSHTFVLSEFRLTDDYRRVIPSSERSILELPEPGVMHNAGAIEFGPEGYLYVTVGDGGGDGHDGSNPLNLGSKSHAGDWYWFNVGGNGQDLTDNLLGSVLRIDVDNSADERPYEIPADNPLVGERGLEEHFAWGFRNPYSMSFDGDDLYVADVGTKTAEEVNLVEKGGNYGWNVKEGTACHNNSPPLRATSAVDFDVRELPACPDELPNGDPLIDPVIVYEHLPGGAIIGGHVYERGDIPGLNGKFVFGDLRGQIFAAAPAEQESLWEMEPILVSHSEGGTNAHIGDGILSIDTDADGALHVLTAGGTVQRLVSQ